MAEIVRMPKLSDTMTEGVVAKWHKKIGDQVEEGELLADIETDKATMEFESFQSGILLYQGVEEGKTMPVDDVLAIFGEKGEDYKALLTKSEAPLAQSEATSEAAAATTAIEPVVEEDLSGIAATIIEMPKLSDTMTEGVVAKWHKKIGDQVQSGDLLAEIETDKATMEFEAFEEGTLLHIGVEEGQSAPVESVLAVVGEKGTDFQPLVRQHDQRKSSGETKAEEKPKKSSDAAPVVESRPAEVAKTVVAPSENGRIKASPLAKKMAAERGISLAGISGTGEGGRIVKRDIESYVPGSGMSTASMVEGYRDVEVSQMRKTIARRLSQSKFEAPHFYLTMSIDMDQAIEARRAINQLIEGKISFNDIIIKAAATALMKHPNVNVSWMDDVIRYYDHVHVGVAVAVEDGLLVPVIKHANAKSFSQINTEVKDFAEKARNKTLQPHEWEGSTFTISNLGMYGIEEFTAIINPPNSCILAVGGIEKVPVVKNGQIVPGNRMKVTLSCDHRVVDGATGSEFLNTLKQYLENPITMFM